MARSLALALSLACGLMLAPTVAEACSCRFPPNAQAAADGVSDVFEAVVVAKPTPISDTRTVYYELDVGRVMKGTAAGRIRVVTNASSAACGRSFEPGVTYLVYARAQDNAYSDGSCSFTATKKRALQRGDYGYWGDGPDAPPSTPATPEKPASDTGAVDVPAPETPPFANPTPTTPDTPPANDANGTSAPTVGEAPGAAKTRGCSVAPEATPPLLLVGVIALLGRRRRRDAGRRPRPLG